jgi:hypothetical protein
MRCFSRVMSERVRDATLRRFRRQVRTNKQHQLTAYTDPWQARKASVPSLPARYRQGRGRQCAEGSKQGRGRGAEGGISYVPSLITRCE